MKVLLPVKAYDEWLSVQLEGKKPVWRTIEGRKLRRIVEMLRGGERQVDIAEALGLSVKNVSKWVGLLPEDMR